MARKFRVAARITAEDRASGTIGRVQGRFARLSGFIRKNMVAALGVATIAFVAIFKAMQKVIGAASEQQDAVNALTSALASLGPASAKVSSALQAQAGALQLVTRFGDETIIRGQSLLATFTQNEEELKKGTIAALDFAAATGRNLTTAFLLLGKAAVGETAELSRYGIIIDQNIPKSEKFAAVLQKMNAQFGGRAQADVKTFSGAMAKLGNAIGDVAEAAGSAVTENNSLADSISRWADVIAIGVSRTTETVKATRGLRDINLSTTGSYDQLRQEIQRGLEAQGRSSEEIKNLLQNFQTLRFQIGSTADAWKFLIEQEERSLRLQRELNKESAAFDTFLSEIGTTLEIEVTNKIKEYADQLDFARRNQDTLKLSNEDLIRIEKDTASAIEDLREQLLGAADDASTSGDALESFGTSAGRARRDVDGLTESLDRNVRALDRNAIASRRPGSSIGGPLISQQGPLISGGGPSGGVFTITRRNTTTPDGRVVIG